PRRSAGDRTHHRQPETVTENLARRAGFATRRASPRRACRYRIHAGRVAQGVAYEGGAVAARSHRTSGGEGDREARPDLRGEVGGPEREGVAVRHLVGGYRVAGTVGGADL